MEVEYIVMSLRIKFNKGPNMNLYNKSAEILSLLHGVTNYV